MRSQNLFKKFRKHLNVYGMAYLRLSIWKTGSVNAILTLITLFIAILVLAFKGLVEIYLPGLAGSFLVNLIVAIGIIPFFFTVVVLDIAWLGTLAVHLIKRVNS